MLRFHVPLVRPDSRRRHPSSEKESSQDRGQPKSGQAHPVKLPATGGTAMNGFSYERSSYFWSGSNVGAPILQGSSGSMDSTA